MVDVFISYSHQDRAAVDKLASCLESMGISVWRDQAIRLGANWMQEIEQALNDTKVFVFCLSPNFLASDWAQYEIGVALSRSREVGVRVVPVLLHDVLVPSMLDRFCYIDARQLGAKQIASLIRNAVSSSDGI